MYAVEGSGDGEGSGAGGENTGMEFEEGMRITRASGFGETVLGLTMP